MVAQALWLWLAGAQTDDNVFWACSMRRSRATARLTSSIQFGQALRFYLDLLRNYSPHERIQGYTRDLAIGGETFQLIDEWSVCGSTCPAASRS